MALGPVRWALTALVAALPWFGLLRHDQAPESTARDISLGAVARTRLGWGMALFFGFQSLQAYSVFGWFAQVYRDAGFSAGTAGLLLGVITAMSIPLSFWLPAWAARMEHQTWLIVGLIACYPIGYVGLIVAPVAGAWLWAVLVGDRGVGVPGGAHPDRPAGADQRGHRRAVRLHPVGGLPDRGDRPVRHGLRSTTSPAAGPSR